MLRGVTKDSRFETAEWIRGTIRKITKDPVYLGNRVHGKVKRDKIGMEKTRRPSEQWQIIPNAHQPIISEELYEAVQEVNRRELETRKSYGKRAEAAVDYRDIFRGKLICGDCKSTMAPAKGCARPEAKTPSRIFYDCNNYRYSNHTKCSSHYIRQETLMNAVINLLNQQIRVCVDIEKLIQDIMTDPDVVCHQDAAKNHYTGICVKRKNLEAKIEQLLTDLTEKVITREEYLYMKERYEKQMTELLQEEASVMKEKSALDVAVNTTRKWITAIKKYQEIPIVDRELVDELIDSIEVYEDRHIKINLNFADPYRPVMEYLNEIGVMLRAG